MKNCPKKSAISFRPDISFVYLDIAFTTSRWLGALIQLSALHGDDELNLFVKPSNFESVDEEKLLKWTGLHWDGSTLTKKGISVPTKEVLDPLDALLKLILWLRKRKPAVIMSFNYAFNDTLQLLRLLRLNGLEEQFREVCIGFVSIWKVIQKKKSKGKSRLEYMKDLCGDAHNTLPDALSLKLLLGKKEKSHKDLLKYSFEFESLKEHEYHKEEMYQKMCSFEPLISNGVIDLELSRRMAYDGMTFQGLVETFYSNGNDVLAAHLRHIDKCDKIDSLFYKGIVRKINETDIERICKFLVEKYGQLFIHGTVPYETHSWQK